MVERTLLEVVLRHDLAGSHFGRHTGSSMPPRLTLATHVT
jgi:hypothetical protein